MEPLYPQNILERTFPILRERREKEEREALAERDREDDAEPVLGWASEVLYEELPYEGGPTGKHLNTFA